jgi:flagellar FliJ protein
MAKRFTFRLETLLKIRRQREERHQRIVADRLRQIQEVEDQLTAIAHQIQSEEQAIMANQRQGVIDMQQVVRHRHWLGHLHKCALDAKARRGYLEAQLAQERAALAEAAKQRKILDKLKERQWERYRQEQDYQETGEADEMATIRYVFDRRAELEPVGA